MGIDPRPKAGVLRAKLTDEAKEPCHPYCNRAIPMERPLYRCMTKATNRELGEPRLSQNWLWSRRGWFKVFPDRVACGDWDIPFSEIQEVVLYRSRWSFMPVSVLKIRVAGETYQFGFNPWAHPEAHLSIPYREENVKLRLSLFSFAVRAISILVLLYLVWTELRD